MTNIAPRPAEPEDLSFACWFDPNGDPYAIYFRSDESSEGTEARWFCADQHNGSLNEVMTWAGLLDEMDGLGKGPFLLEQGERIR